MRDTVLTIPSFRFLLLGRIALTVSNQMLMLIVGWQMYAITHSACELGIVGLTQFAPALMLCLVIGQIVDRHDRRRILIGCLVGQCAVCVLLLLGTLHGWLGRDLLLVASFGLGLAKAFQMPAQQALMPTLVPLPLLPRALATTATVSQFSIIVGPAVGGFIYAAGAAVVYLVCAGIGVLGMITIAMIRPGRAASSRAPMTLQSLVSGVQFIWKRKEVLGATSLDLFAVLFGGATALLPVFARDVLHTDSWGMGLLRSAPALGALVVSLYLARHPLQRRVGKKMLSAVCLYGVATVIFALSRYFALSFMALMLTGAFDMVSNVVRQSLVQLQTPDDMRGRVSAVNSIFVGASNQLGEFESGVTAGLFGAVPSVWIGGVGTVLIVMLWFRLFPGLANRESLLVGEPSRPACDG